VDALTHLNYAFAYIDPPTFDIITMDVKTPVSLFDDFADLKVVRPDLKLFVSVGGWTFSNNNTDTQPVFGNIARSSSNRESFAKKMLAFLNEYGFDGIDIDW
jgi:chitinase